MILDRLIVMDNISDLADKLEELTNFLAVSRKYGLTYVYIFHTLYPTRQHIFTFCHRLNLSIFFLDLLKLFQ